jgi:uncharacterized protein (TIGR02391 family)
MSKEITDITKSDIAILLNRLRDEDDRLVSWSGKIREIDFLNRIFKLSDMPSTDSRYETAEQDIWQHRVNNYDWEDDWIFNDKRFSFDNDDTFLNFVAEVFHPLVRYEQGNWRETLKQVNELLAYDGFVIVPKKYISGREIFGWDKIDKRNPKQIVTTTTFSNSTAVITIRPEIAYHIERYINQRDYYHAIEEAYKVVRKKLKDITKKEKATDIFSASAENEKYHEDLFGGKVEKGTPEADFRRGVGYLNLAIQFLRNEKMHSLATDIEENLAIHYISLASLSYDLITQKDKS